LCARLERGSWTPPPLFAWLQRTGNVAETEMLRVFNCGIGMVVIVAGRDAGKASEILRSAGETVWRIGTIAARAPGEEQTVVC
jgi:phosphoribosylformylglycinamidine cyclo-ligase